MAHFLATVDVDASPAVTWAALVDWPSHGRWVPLTRVRVVTASGAGVGARFVGRSGIGRLGFDDPMEVVEWRPPTSEVSGWCAVVKHGRVVLGTARFEVSALPEGRSRVVWAEDVEVAPVRLTRPFGGLLALAGRVAFTRTLRAMAREVAGAR